MIVWHERPTMVRVPHDIVPRTNNAASYPGLCALPIRSAIAAAAMLLRHEAQVGAQELPAYWRLLGWSQLRDQPYLCVKINPRALSALPGGL